MSPTSKPGKSKKEERTVPLDAEEVFEKLDTETTDFPTWQSYSPPEPTAHNWSTIELESHHASEERIGDSGIRDERFLDPNEWINQTIDSHDVDRGTYINRSHGFESHLGTEEHKYDVDAAEYRDPIKEKPKLSNWFGHESLNPNPPPPPGTSEDEVRAYVQQQIEDHREAYKRWKKVHGGGGWAGTDHGASPGTMVKRTAMRAQFSQNKADGEADDETLGADSAEEGTEQMRAESEEPFQSMPATPWDMDAQGGGPGGRFQPDPDERLRPGEIPSHIVEREKARWREKHKQEHREEMEKIQDTRGGTEAMGDDWFDEEFEDNWWGAYGSAYGERFSMPHQTLHGGVTEKDPEEDMPLNTYWHKSTLTPDNWSILRKKFRDNMVPSSQTWNEVAYRNEFERESVKYWPTTFQQWFVRSEEELLGCHDFRCKMMDHSALEEYWRLGELRWNRKFWLPYIRLANWVIIPLVGLYGYYSIRNWNPFSMEKLRKEHARWKHMMVTGDADEYYTFTLGQQHARGDMPDMQQSMAPAIEDLESIQKRTVANQLNTLIHGEQESPY